MTKEEIAGLVAAARRSNARQEVVGFIRPEIATTLITIHQSRMRMVGTGSRMVHPHGGHTPTAVVDARAFLHRSQWQIANSHVEQLLGCGMNAPKPVANYPGLPSNT